MLPHQTVHAGFPAHGFPMFFIPRHAPNSSPLSRKSCTELLYKLYTKNGESGRAEEMLLQYRKKMVDHNYSSREIEAKITLILAAI